jgi:hypothetical protein
MRGCIPNMYSRCDEMHRVGENTTWILDILILFSSRIIKCGDQTLVCDDFTQMLGK